MRAFLSLIMLLGFLFVAVLLFAAVGGLAIWLAVVAPAIVALKITLPLFVALVGGAGVAIWRALRAKHEPMPGVTITPQQAPRLWEEVRGLSRAAGTRAPDEIRIVADVNAAVSEHSKLLGIISGRRYLYLGMPLLQALSLGQMRAVLAHELGHYSGSHSRLGAVAYRGRLAIAGTVGRIGRMNPIGWAFKLYGMLYLLVDNAVSRRQELEADAAAVRVAGKRAAIGALTEVSVAAMAYDFYLGRYVAPGTEFGLLPDNIFAGFTHLVAERQDELAELRKDAPDREQGSKWDTHPPLAVRIAAIQALPDSPVAEDPRPAIGLLPDIDALGRALQQLVVETRNRRVMSWPEFTAMTATSQLQEQSDRIFRQLSRALGQPVSGVAHVFAALEAGQAGPMGEAFHPDATGKAAAVKFAEPLELLLRLAAVRSGMAFWRHSWTQGPELTDRHGQPLDLEEVAKLAVGPGTLPQARARLAELGVVVESAAVQEQAATTRGSNVIAGMANTKVDGADADLLVLDDGLIVVPGGGKTDEGRNRMITVLQQTPVDKLSQFYRFIPYEEIKSVTIAKKVPLRAQVHLHNGQSVELREAWTGKGLHKQSAEVTRGILQRFAED
ncbi:MAG TPA: M48 family metallopeptidase [Candidatus Limnocylindrales bacterium]|nr:M48 family metallopeptidase [Candidatus Limnocylindrales bacterium]